MVHSQSLDKRKQALRINAKSIRKIAMANFTNEKQKKFFKNLFKVITQTDNDSVVSTYIAIGDEIDLKPLMNKLWKSNMKVALPVVVAKNQPLIFREWSPFENLVSGPFNTQHPRQECPKLVPDTILVPLLCYDKFGGRLGWGGGFYDRTIASLRAQQKMVRVIGIGLSAQERDHVPRDRHDEKIDMIINESNIVKFSAELGN